MVIQFVSIAEHVLIMVHTQHIIIQLSNNYQMQQSISNLLQYYQILLIMSLNDQRSISKEGVPEIPSFSISDHSINQMPFRINADNSSPRDVFLFWLIFLFVLLFSIVLAMLVAPEQVIIKTNLTELKNTVDHSCLNPSGFENNTLVCNPFGSHNPYLGLLLRDVSVWHQFALIYIQFENQNKEKIHKINQNISVTLYSMQIIVKQKRGHFLKGQQIGSRQFSLEDQDQLASFSFYNQQIRHLIGFYRHLSDKNYLLLLKFTDSEQIVSNGLNPSIKAIMINPKFSLFLVIIRSIGFFITLLTGLFYLKNYYSFSSQKLIQQKLVLIMSVLILFFNDPLYFLEIIKPSLYTSMLSIIFLCIFVVYLFFFWGFGALRILTQQAQIRSSLTKPFNILILLLYFGSYLFVIGSYLVGITKAYYEGHFLLNPSQISPKLTSIFTGWLVTNIIIYVYIVVKIWRNNKALLWRSRLWLYFNTYFAILLIIFIKFIGSFYQENSKLLLVTFTSINLYSIYMQYMFMAQIPTQSNSQNDFKPVNTLNEQYFTAEDQISIEISNIPNKSIGKEV